MLEDVLLLPISFAALWYVAADIKPEKRDILLPLFAKPIMPPMANKTLIALLTCCGLLMVPVRTGCYYCIQYLYFYSASKFRDLEGVESSC